MRLEAGAIRELHWHKQAEWAYVLEGGARVTAMDAEGRPFVDDVGAGDLWYFPSGIPHSIQALREGCELLLVFDDGGFSENATFAICDWLAHAPRDAVARSLGIPEGELSGLPAGERYIFPGAIPGPLDGDRRDGADRPPDGFTYRLLRDAPIESAGGRVRIVDSRSFAVSATVAAALVDVEPGGMRELHWHPNADEWQYYVEGAGRMTVFAAEGRSRTFDFGAGDVGYVPFAMGHHIENAGDTRLRFLEMFRADRFADVSLARWAASTPPGLLAQHLHVEESVLRRLRTRKEPVVG
jgi:oxalate decarboxylase